MPHRRVSVLLAGLLTVVAAIVAWRSFADDPDVSEREAITVEIEQTELEELPDGRIVDVGAESPGPVDLDDREVIDASEMTGPVVLEVPNRIYDFGGVVADRDITIAASFVEARNIRGPGARRIGERDGEDYIDSGFRDFEFTYMQTQNGGGGELIRPYFIDGVDINPDGREGEGSPAHIYAYQGDIVEPLIENVTVRGWRVPDGSQAHNDAIHFTGIEGGVVRDPTLRNSSVKTGSALGVLLRHTHGLVTIEGSTFETRYTAFHAVLANGEGVDEVTTVLWTDNDLVRASTATLINGVVLDPRSDSHDQVQVLP